AVEAGDDDGVELEALGAVDGHDLDRVLRRLYVGLGVEAAVDLVLERREVDLARLFKALELVEEDLGVLEIGLAFDARRAAERERQRVEVLHDLLLAELLDVEGAEAHARLLERRHDLVEVRAVADEDRLAARSLPDDSNDLLRFLLAVVAAVPGHGGAGKRRL